MALRRVGFTIAIVSVGFVLHFVRLLRVMGEFGLEGSWVATAACWMPWPSDEKTTMAAKEVEGSLASWGLA
jgi:hypothetical protein